MDSFVPRVLERCKRIAHWVSEQQTALIYTLLYFTLVGPIALLRRLFSDPFQYRKRGGSTFWVPRGQVPPTLAEARRQ